MAYDLMSNKEDEEEVGPSYSRSERSLDCERRNVKEW